VNVKEYISSGIVESYVLGLATEPERLEFETACQQYPEVLQARMQFEQALEAKLLQDAVAPPAGLKQKISDAINSSEAQEAQTFSNVHTAPVRRMGVWNVLAAASVAALIGVLIWAITLNAKNQALQQQNLALQKQAQAASAQLAQLRQDAQRMKNPGVKMAAMQGTAIAPGALATVYWDTTSKDVYMMVNNLPQPASDKQYQLWALIDNKPVDLGVFELRQQRLLVKMKNVQNAQAFAITLEPIGGSPTPTPNAIYVMGKL
jgi:anti-sigma-K factor RskA